MRSFDDLTPADWDLIEAAVSPHSGSGRPSTACHVLGK